VEVVSHLGGEAEAVEAVHRFFGGDAVHIGVWKVEQVFHVWVDP